MTLEEINLRLAKWYPQKVGFFQNPQRDLVKLTEEVGELAKGILKGDKANIKEEIADVAIVLLHLCRFYKIDLLETVSEKIPILEERLRVFRESRYQELGNPSPTTNN